MQGGTRDMAIGPLNLPGTLRMPKDALGTVVFAQGSGGSRLSPSNVRVAEKMGEAGLATLLFDLLTDDEAQVRRNGFDISLLAERLSQAVRDLAGDDSLAGLPIGLFGASTGAAAALVAAARLPGKVVAVVSYGGRPDLARDALRKVKAATLLIVGSRDQTVLQVNREAMADLGHGGALEIIRGAGHLFEEPGALDSVAVHAANWFHKTMAGGRMGHGASSGVHP